MEIEAAIYDNSDVEEEYRSCCTEDEDWQDTEESLAEGYEECMDQYSMRMFFKGVSIRDAESLGSRFSGIGVVMERTRGVPVLQVQKKLGFFVEEPVAEHLALIDGLLEALRSGVRRIYAYTDSEVVYYQVAELEELEDPLLVALGLRILEHADKFEDFVLKLVPSSELERPLRLAQEAVGIIYQPFNGDGSTEDCRICCPFPNCLTVLSTTQCSSFRASSSSHTDVNCIECPECSRLFCMSCGVPWHPSVSCEEFRNLPAEERDVADISFLQLAQNTRWRRCQQCRRMIELTQGCYHMTCWCGHEFCYSCGAERRDGVQTCQCALWDGGDNDDDRRSEPSTEACDLRRWESFDSLPTAVEGYSEQERAQLALIQRFLTGGFDLGDHHPCPSPPQCSDSYVDAIKDLHQLPWLERFVSVISDNYHEDFIQ